MTLKGLFDPTYPDEAEAENDFILKNGMAVSYFMEANYLDYLQHCLDGPILRFQKGNIDIKGKKTISVVGTLNITIQRASMEKGLQTIGCLAHGLSQIYPKAHKNMLQELKKMVAF